MDQTQEQDAEAEAAFDKLVEIVHGDGCPNLCDRQFFDAGIAFARRASPASVSTGGAEPVKIYKCLAGNGRDVCGGEMLPWNARQVHRDGEDKVVLRCTRCGATTSRPTPIPAQQLDSTASADRSGGAASDKPAGAGRRINELKAELAAGEGLPCKCDECQRDIAQLLKQIPALAAERDAAQQLANRLDIALQSLTPGGSEYHNDPERCVAHVRDRLDCEHNHLLAAHRELAELRRALEEARAMVAKMRGAATWFSENAPGTPVPDWVDVAMNPLPPAPVAEQPASGQGGGE